MYYLDNHRITYKNNQYDVLNDLEYIGGYDTTYRPYLRVNIKISIFKWLKEHFPEEYELVSQKWWFIEKYNLKTEQTLLGR